MCNILLIIWGQSRAPWTPGPNFFKTTLKEILFENLASFLI